MCNSFCTCYQSTISVSFRLQRSDGVDIRSKGICRLYHFKRTRPDVHQCAFTNDYLDVCGGYFFSESLRNECPEGSCELLRGLMIVGVLKRLQIMSQPKPKGVLLHFF